VIFISIIDILASAYILLIFVRALMTWFKPEIVYAYRRVFDIVASLTDPLLDLMRRFFPAALGRMDISPVLAMIFIELMRFLLIAGIRALILSRMPGAAG
jgi:uncharacterized protein YggT (Ycf19 family)